jgi:hypothetical protein
LFCSRLQHGTDFSKRSEFNFVSFGDPAVARGLYLPKARALRLEGVLGSRFVPRSVKVVDCP